MIQKGNFILFTRDEFKEWLEKQAVKRVIKMIQNHHTYEPSYDNFNGKNHFEKLEGMRDVHMRDRGFDDVAQNLTTFNDGMIALSIGRNLDKIPAGIKGANANGICIEHVANFDIGGDKMTEEHRKTILFVNAILCKKFKLPVTTEHVVYHHWWSANGNKVYHLRTGEYLGGIPSKSCPGTAFFGGNKVGDAQNNFIPLILRELKIINNNGKLEVIEAVMKSLSKYFCDVEAKWAVESIDNGKEKGFFTVPADKKFHPTDPITRQEMAVVINKVVDHILKNKG